ncbi:hypothetical protein SPRG_10023 [Saprolegnia parasitica CBS 223.65]|uniref:Amino acid transporter n=1 Tax=Saprolegnia parasitica (strain CBS 223.65) TaxID=695850 RepID=A0A067CBG5_SAPPC|nr:hypothetical protein SPRG_10023 [Saprolegnia parasitica CBS 223.65]KDO23876.1 hypothetical protein SPRG_10023 [Saprolegnia parasitica CBS 223.65]|eukprot:XP_012205349.1 hypothetical protein SPRG_10023 [Saprolegnia parasitica CBS 223.65]
MDSGKGIYLFDADALVTPTPKRQTEFTTPTRDRRGSQGLLSVVSSTSSHGRKAPPPEMYNVRTNFKTTPNQSEASFPATPPVTQLDFHGDPIMEEEHKSSPMHPTYARKTAGLSSSLWILMAAVLGIGLGLGLGKLEPSADTLAWIALPGDLFVRALKCLIVPLVFCTMTVSIAEVIELKRTSLLTWRTVGVFLLTSFLSACQGLGAALVYRSLLTARTTGTATAISTGPTVAFQCANGRFLHAYENGSVACSAAQNATSSETFTMLDVNGALHIATPLSATTLSLTQQAIAIINQAVPDNIFQALSDGTLLSVIAFALPLGVAVARSHHSSLPGPNELLALFRQARNALLLLVTGTLRFTPIAVLFLLTNAMATYTKASSSFASHAGYVVLCFFSVVLTHVGVVLPCVLYLLIRVNPYAYMRQLVPAYVFAFGCSSSMATLPVAVTVIHQTRKVTRSTAQLIMCLGTPTNMNAAGLYHPLMVVFMVYMEGMLSELTTPKLVILFCISLVGSMGTAPVPNAGLIMLLTVWKTVFPTAPLPHSFVYVVAMDFLLGRIRVMVNVNGNMMATRILAHGLDEHSTDEENNYA